MLQHIATLALFVISISCIWYTAKTYSENNYKQCEMVFGTIQTQAPGDIAEFYRKEKAKCRNVKRLGWLAILQTFCIAYLLW